METITSNRMLAPQAPHPTAERAAAANCPLLIIGETGTDKGFLAKWIHQHSARGRNGGPFVPVNCAAIPDSLIDSHLFGHAKGSFSDAATDHLGLIRAASGGTILFDEISELPLTAQTRLLRLLEEREVQPIGYSKPVIVDVRVMAATSGDLAATVRAGTFREDLFFRLDVVRMALRPLRERRAELADLLERFNHEFAMTYRQPPLVFESEAMDMLVQYRWPGNVRELRTVIERLHVLRGSGASLVSAAEVRTFGQLSMPLPCCTASQTGTNRMRLVELEAVQAVMNACRGNVSRAASRLGVHRSTIYRWLAQPVAA